jgi:hypothetical protein
MYFPLIFIQSKNSRNTDQQPNQPTNQQRDKKKNMNITLDFGTEKNIQYTETYLEDT